MCRLIEMVGHILMEQMYFFSTFWWNKWETSDFYIFDER